MSSAPMRKPPLQDVIVRNGGPRPPRPIASHEEYTQRPRPARTIDSMNAVALPPRREYRQEEPSHQRREREETEYEPAYHHRVPEEPRDRGESRWLSIALGIGALIIVSAVGLSFMFAGASVTVYPKQDTVVVNTSVVAAKDGENGALAFERIVIERTASKPVPAQKAQEVEERASGKITVYNAYSETPQRLIKNTRFQSEGGKIFRIRESIEVPGKKSDTTPGTIEVSVFAEEPGEDYNIPAGNFTVPGFAKLPQEGKVYAKSSAPMGGGFKGVRRTVEESARQDALKSLEQQLRDELLAAAFESGDKPAGYHLFKEAVFFEFNPLSDEVSGEEQITLSLTGKVHGLLFPEEAFAERIATLTIGSYTGSGIRLDNPYDLSVSVAPGGQEPPQESGDAPETGTPVPAWEATTYTVRVEGKAHFIWSFDDQALAADLVDKDKKVLDVVQGGMLDAYPGIDRIHATVRPFWKKTFPDDQKDIVIVTELDSE